MDQFVINQPPQSWANNCAAITEDLEKSERVVEQRGGKAICMRQQLYRDSVAFEGYSSVDLKVIIRCFVNLGFSMDHLYNCTNQKRIIFHLKCNGCTASTSVIT